MIVINSVPISGLEPTLLDVWYKMSTRCLAFSSWNILRLLSTPYRGKMRESNLSCVRVLTWIIIGHCAVPTTTSFIKEAMPIELLVGDVLPTLVSRIVRPPIYVWAVGIAMTHERLKSRWEEWDLIACQHHSPRTQARPIQLVVGDAFLIFVPQFLMRGKGMSRHNC